ncbi:hypothetical protein [Georgenia yuyongxinii]|nr:hypothetical protein [Georgenia yuyongxinii]
MSVVALGQLTRDVCRRPDARQLLLDDPAALLARYRVTTDEREAVLDLDAQALVDLGLNPVVMRNLLATAGIGNAEIYTHSRSLRRGATSA